MGRYAAVLNTAYVLAGCALFATGEAPVVAPGVDFLGNKFAVAWAGWKFSGCLYMALVEFGIDLKYASAIVMCPYIAFDIYAVMDSEHWAGLAYSFIILEVLVMLTALLGRLKFGGIVNATYVLAGCALFATGEAPVVVAGVDFLGDTFSVAWAGMSYTRAKAAPFFVC